MSDLLMTFYGDDFTGSTDALEALTLGGVPSVLFIRPPTREELARDFSWTRAIGVAGSSRAMTPAQMDSALPPVFRALHELGAPICHYKVCSTFDSSPAVGSIGRALELGAAEFDPTLIPIVIGAPWLRRYVIFGNLFAGVSAEHGPITYRLDRHPTMAHHPVTPMNESDLRLHLARQTDWPIGLIDLLLLDRPEDEIDDAVTAQLQADVRAILFDTLDSDHLLIIGRRLLREAQKRPLFIVGSSGVEGALVAAWQAAGAIEPNRSLAAPTPVDQIVVMAGSASPATAEQLDWAKAHNFACMPLDADLLVNPATLDAACETYCRAALEQLHQGLSVAFYSAWGRLPAQVLASGPEYSRALGVAQGRLLRMILERSGIRRACIAGGDTSSRAVQQLGITALTVSAKLAPGSPLCRAHAPGRLFDGLELVLKGGQVGSADFFGQVRGG
ncbi:MAG: four-carbon acid sugar kinase family protein [Caldilineaceae bacterium]|nr:four-carbon acid sugar kinase family protein [Caldilineaceae bacterium]